MRVHFDQELAELQEQVLVLGSRAGEAVARGVQALLDGDTDLAREVIANDLAINDLRYAIERSCYALLAQEQPVAGDMRRIVAALTMVLIVVVVTLPAAVPEWQRILLFIGTGLAFYGITTVAICWRVKCPFCRKSI
jgi:hypothetical protein